MGTRLSPGIRLTVAALLAAGPSTAATTVSPEPEEPQQIEAAPSTVAPAEPSSLQLSSGAEPPTREKIIDALAKGRVYLLKNQHLKPGDFRDGAWLFSSDRDQRIDGFNATHFYTAASVTAWCLRALKATGGLPADRAQRASRRVHSFAFMEVNKGGAYEYINYRLYALAYGLGAALDGFTGGVPDLIPKYVKALSGVAKSEAGVSYFPAKKGGAASFQMALVVLELARAGPPARDVMKAFAAGLEKNRAGGGRPVGRFEYSRGAKGVNTMRGPQSELALLRAGQSDADRLWEAVYWFFRNHGAQNKFNIDPDADPHIGKEAGSNYFYLFHAYYTSEALLELMRLDPGDNLRKKHEKRGAAVMQGYNGALVPPARAHEARILISSLLSLQRPDGSWEDSSRFSGPNYGTAAAILALVNLDRVLKNEKK